MLGSGAEVGVESVGVLATAVGVEGTATVDGAAPAELAGDELPLLRRGSSGVAEGDVCAG